MHNTTPCHQHLPLTLTQVSYTCAHVRLIDELDLTINSPGNSVILGHNGAGKSLLLKLLHGVITPSGGHIHWQQDRPQPQQYWRTLLLQKPSFFDRSVRYNVEFVLQLAKVPKAQRQQRCDEALQVCALRDMAERNASTLSGGEAQKLSLARAWVLKPAILLMDEPTVALDPPSVISFEKIIHQFVQAQTKIIMTTHDLAQAKRMADDIVFMHAGKILEHRPAQDFFAKPDSEHAQRFISGEL